MRIKIEEDERTSERELEDGTSVLDLLETLGKYPDAHIVLINGTPVPLTQVLRSSDDVRVIKVASGG
jgi:sulfur carrier protein ThiS